MVKCLMEMELPKDAIKDITNTLFSDDVLIKRAMKIINDIADDES